MFIVCPGRCGTSNRSFRFMKKTIRISIGLLFLLTFFKATAQYNISPIAPPPNFTFNDLWHLTVLRGSTDNYTQFYISLRILDDKNALKVKSNSAFFGMDVGSRYFNLSNINLLQPFNSSYYDATVLREAIASGGQFPPGTYNMVYTLYGKASDGAFTPLAEENVQTRVEVMWPPILLWPEDKAVLTDPHPVLTWTPAFSSSFTGTITYDLKLVEVLKGQTAEEAMLANPAFFTMDKLVNTTYPYTAEAPALNEKATYAWLVQARLGDVRASSQLWKFSFSPDIPVNPAAPQFYAPVLEKLDGSYAMSVDYTLKLKYTEEYELPTSGYNYLIYNLYDQDGVKIRSSLPPLSSLSLPVKKGDNYLALPLGNPGLNLSGNRFYILEVMNHKNEKWYLRFNIVTNALPD